LFLFFVYSKMMRRGLTLFASAGVRTAPTSSSRLFLTTSRLASSDAAPSPVPRKNVKASTGIAGLDVVPNAREVLIGLYNKYLAELQVIEPTSPYRKLVENMTRERLRVPPPHRQSLCANIVAPPPSLSLLILCLAAHFTLLDCGGE
jgi:hypothetical protein